MELIWVPPCDKVYLAQKLVETSASEYEKLPTHTHGECPKTLSEGPIIHIWPSVKGTKYLLDTESEISTKILFFYI